MVIDAFVEDNLVHSVDLIGVWIEIDFGAWSDFDSTSLKHKQSAYSISSAAWQQFVKRQSVLARSLHLFEVFELFAYINNGFFWCNLFCENTPICDALFDQSVKHFLLGWLRVFTLRFNSLYEFIKCLFDLNESLKLLVIRWTIFWCVRFSLKLNAGEFVRTFTKNLFDLARCLVLIQLLFFQSFLLNVNFFFFTFNFLREKDLTEVFHPANHWRSAEFLPDAPRNDVMKLQVVHWHFEHWKSCACIRLKLMHDF